MCIFTKIIVRFEASFCPISGDYFWKVGNEVASHLITHLPKIDLFEICLLAFIIIGHENMENLAFLWYLILYVSNYVYYISELN